jgi:hypothetical protein
MNCFNIRELQGILKRKFFTDLVNTSDSHTATESTLINMRHKNNMSNILLYDQSLLYNFDLTNTSKYKNFSFNPGKVYTYTTLSYYTTNLKAYNLFNNFYMVNIYMTFSTLLKDLMNFIYIPSIISVTSILSSFKYVSSSLSSGFFFKTPVFSESILGIFTNFSTNTQINTPSTYSSSTVNYSNYSDLSSSSLSENSSS